MARVLVVDDTDIVRRALELALRRMGHAPIAAVDAPTALGLALANPPDLALVDYRLPGMDGVDLYREMMAALGERCPPVLFVSASAPEEIAERVRGIGRPAGYVKKPFNVDDLARTVAGVLDSPPLDAAPARSAATAGS